MCGWIDDAVMENEMKDDLLSELQRIDWDSMSLDQAKDKFVELTKLYDFKGKSAEHARAVMSKTSKYQVIQFIWNVAMSGINIKVKSKYA